nr:hypothetical protein [Tanacetum cinerariifolium]
KNLDLIAKYFKKIYKPANNNLRTSSNSRNKNVDMTPRYKNDDHSGQFRNQRTVNVAGAREKVGSPIVQQSGIQKCGKLSKGYNKIYKPTNNNLRTSSNSRNKNVDTTPWYKNDDQSGQFGNQRTMNIDGARENIGSPIVQQSGIHCFNCKEFGHFAKECRKPKKVKDSAYHKEKMLMCKQAEKGVPLKAEQYDWLAGTDKEIDEKELEAHYSLETDDSNVIPDSANMCDDDIQNDKNDVESDDERVALANLKLDVDENKNIPKKLKKANTTLAQELKECKTILAKTSK